MADAELSDDELIIGLRRQAAAWFNNTNLLRLEELIRRFNKLKQEKARG